MLCHKSIRKIAREIAGAAYEEFACDDVFFKAYPDQKYFVERHWKNFINQARQSITAMLGGDYPDSMKEDLFEIVVQDRTLQAVNDLGKTHGSA